MSANNDLMLDVSQAAELKMAFRRNGWTNKDIKALSEGCVLGDVLRVIRGQAEIVYTVPKWTEGNGVIRFSVTSDGTTGEGWITRLESQGFRVGEYAKSVLRSVDFKPTSDTYEIVVLKGMLWDDNDRITKKIRAEAKKRKLFSPNAEVACLIREKFSDKELEAMGLNWIVAMHKPIKDSGGDPLLLFAFRLSHGSWLYSFYVDPDRKWSRSGGFAFVVSQV